MNRIIRSRLSCIAVLLIVSMALVGCSQNCDICGLTCFVLGWGNIVLALACFTVFCPECLPNADLTAISQFCEENPAQCAATFEQMQITAIQFCEEYPEECQQTFDDWVDSLDEEASK